MGPPRVCVEAELPLQLERLRAINDLERQGKLLRRFVSPLAAEQGRAEHEHAADATAEHELMDHHAGLDRFAEV